MQKEDDHMQLERYVECLSLGRHDQAEAFTRVIQPDDSQYDVCRSCGFLQTVVKEPDRAFERHWATWCPPEELPDARGA